MNQVAAEGTSENEPMAGVPDRRKRVVLNHGLIYLRAEYPISDISSIDYMLGKQDIGSVGAIVSSIRGEGLDCLLTGQVLDSYINNGIKNYSGVDILVPQTSIVPDSKRNLYLGKYETFMLSNHDGPRVQVVQNVSARLIIRGNKKFYVEKGVDNRRDSVLNINGLSYDATFKFSPVLSWLEKRRGVKKSPIHLGFVPEEEIEAKYLKLS